MTFRPHSTDADAYEDHLHHWESIVDGEEDGSERARIRAASGSDEPTTLVARLYGCESWDRFVDHLATVAADDGYVAAHAAIEAGDREGLARIVAAEPELVTARGPEGATLLDHAIWKTDHGDWSWPPGPSDWRTKPSCRATCGWRRHWDGPT
jgi:hypothetical protein